MNNKTRISATALLAVASMAASPAAWSLGLGDATVESYLNQPLKARIDLVTRENDDLASVSAKLASAADYELIGASLEDISVPVRFSVEDVDGDAYLLASSQLQLNNPVIRLIVEVNWSSGRMLREYTLFLDPPVVADQAPIPRIDQRESVQAPPPAVEAPAVQPREEPVSEPAVSQATTTSAPESGEYGPVASGETLWGIAKNWSSGTGMSVNQVMIAIQRENPDAFLNNNINLLKRGAILRMPARQDVERISSAVAFNEVVTQEEEFYESKGMPPVTSPSMPLLAEESAAPNDDYAYPDPQQPVVEPEPEPVAVEPEPEADVAAEQEIAAVTPESDESGEESATDEAAAEPAQEMAEDAVEEPAPQDQLELVPPSQASELDSTYGFEESEEDGDAAVASQALRESLARTEEDLITQQQQNEYLQERIRELEGQLEAAEDANVADSDMANMAQRLREERLAQQPDDAAEPWYSRLGVWLLGVLVLAAALAGWLFSRRSGDDVGEETIQEIKDEAEEVLRVLKDSEPEESAEETDDEEMEDESGEEETPEDEEEETAQEAPVAKPKGADDEADFLDEESSDPEIQLDLARAYISMGDKEAARVILEEVATNGTEEQQAEAQKMLDLM
jgi:pilus assembly protein FimV